MEEKPKKLENYQEIIGVLKKVQNQDGRIILTFNITIKVKLIDSPKLIENLKQYIGKKIGIIRADSKYISRWTWEINSVSQKIPKKHYQQSGYEWNQNDKGNGCQFCRSRCDD